VPATDALVATSAESAAAPASSDFSVLHASLVHSAQDLQLGMAVQTWHGSLYESAMLLQIEHGSFFVGVSPPPDDDEDDAPPPPPDAEAPPTPADA